MTRAGQLKFENRQPREGINISRRPPLKKFFMLLISAAILITVLVVVLQFSGAWIARKIPFRVEQAAIEHLEVELGNNQASPPMVAWLNQLADKLSRHMALPPTMTITVHYSDEDIFNAYATLGGQLVFFRGLLAAMPNENALAMVMAHEISHVLHRDPLAGLGGGLASMLALYAVTGQGTSSGATSLLNQTGLLTGVQFTRHMESEADRVALDAVAATYGHVNGADTLFRLTGDQQHLTAVPEWLQRFASTHPLDSDRVQAIAGMAAQAAYSSSGATTPLPAEFDLWLHGDGAQQNR